MMSCVAPQLRSIETVLFVAFPNLLDDTFPAKLRPAPALTKEMRSTYTQIGSHHLSTSQSFAHPEYALSGPPIFLQPCRSLQQFYPLAILAPQKHCCQ